MPKADVPTVIINAAGRIVRSFPDVRSAQAWAERHMPGHQDDAPDGEAPNGWDIQVAGGSRR